MSLIVCPECGGQVSSSAAACPHCGFPITPCDVPREKSKTYQLRLKDAVPFSARSRFMMQLLSVSGVRPSDAKPKLKEAGSVLVDGLSETEAQRQFALLSNSGALLEIVDSGSQDQMQELLRCPYCGSYQIQMMKNGFSFGKAAAGVVVAGPVGAVGGAIGSHKTQRVCLSCGKKF